MNLRPLTHVLKLIRDGVREYMGIPAPGEGENNGADSAKEEEGEEKEEEEEEEEEKKGNSNISCFLSLLFICFDFSVVLRTYN